MCSGYMCKDYSQRATRRAHKYVYGTAAVPFVEDLFAI